MVTKAIVYDSYARDHKFSLNEPDFNVQTSILKCISFYNLYRYPPLKLSALSIKHLWHFTSHTVHGKLNVYTVQYSPTVECFNHFEIKTKHIKPLRVLSHCAFTHFHANKKIIVVERYSFSSFFKLCIG